MKILKISRGKNLQLFHYLPFQYVSDECIWAKGDFRHNYLYTAP
jgi:hypothetical protein